MNIKELVGRNLGLIRKERSISLERVSELTGVSKSMLSEIEKGATNPTIAVLWKIANGLKIPFSELIKSDQNVFRVVGYESRKIIMENGSGMVYGIHEYDESSKSEMYEQIIYPGCVQTSPPHGESAVEYIYVKNGIMEFTTEKIHEFLGTGDSIKFTADSDRSYANKGDDNLEMLIFITYI